jgi:hypothetical protein
MVARKYSLKPSIAVEGTSPEEGYVVLDTHSAAMFSCNESAWLLLERLKAGVTHAELAEAIVRAFGVQPEVAERDAGQFIRYLSVAGMLDESA